MKFKLLLFALMGFCFLSTTSMSVVKPGTSSTNVQPVEKVKPATVHKAHKLNFLQRLVLKYYLKKNTATMEDADKQASTSLLLGVIACGAILLGLVIPYLILASIPAGVAAMITGGSAIRNKTSQVTKAKTGKALGLAAIITFGALILIAIAALAGGAYI